MNCHVKINDHDFQQRGPLDLLKLKIVSSSFNCQTSHYYKSQLLSVMYVYMYVCIVYSDADIVMATELCNSFTH
jgi:hypothetical protein